MGESSVQLRRGGRTVATFLKKTFELLSDPISVGAVGWAESGVGFLIVSEEQFSRRVLPAYFKHSNYSSFVRQLNMYGFHKIRESSQESYFHHPHFLRNRPQDLQHIKRKPEKKKKLMEGEVRHPAVRKPKRLIEREDQVEDEGREEGKATVDLLEVVSEQKVQSEKITQNLFEQTERREESDELSMQVEEREMRVPRVATRELISASRNNVCPIMSIQNVGTSILSIFY